MGTGRRWRGASARLTFDKPKVDGVGRSWDIVKILPVQCVVSL
jgi:hypothetical protein